MERAGASAASSMCDLVLACRLLDSSSAITRILNISLGVYVDQKSQVEITKSKFYKHSQSFESLFT